MRLPCFVTVWTHSVSSPYTSPYQLLFLSLRKKGRGKGGGRTLRLSYTRLFLLVYRISITRSIVEPGHRPPWKGLDNALPTSGIEPQTLERPTGLAIKLNSLNLHLVKHHPVIVQALQGTAFKLLVPGLKVLLPPWPILRTLASLSSPGTTLASLALACRACDAGPAVTCAPIARYGLHAPQMPLLFLPPQPAYFVTRPGWLSGVGWG